MVLFKPPSIHSTNHRDPKLSLTHLVKVGSSQGLLQSHRFTFIINRMKSSKEYSEVIMPDEEPFTKSPTTER